MPFVTIYEVTSPSYMSTLLILLCPHGGESPPLSSFVSIVHLVVSYVAVQSFSYRGNHHALPLHHMGRLFPSGAKVA